MYMKKRIILLYDFSVTTYATPETTTTTENEKTSEGMVKLTSQSYLFLAYW